MDGCGISVIIPVYNVERYLRRCLDSVAAQTFTDFEAIIVNDCSPDRAAEIAQEYCGRDSRFRLINQPQNMGTMMARRVGYESARGKYLMFLDGDDYLPEGALEVLYRTITGDDYDIVFGGYEEVYPDGRRVYLPHASCRVVTKHDALQACLRNNMIWTIWASIYRRELFTREIESVENMSVAEDFILLLHLLHAAERVGVIDDVVYCYYQSEVSMTRSRDPLPFFEQDMRAANRWCDFYKQYYPEYYAQACRLYNRKIVKMMQWGYSLGQIRSTRYINSEIFSTRGLVKYNSLRYLLKMWWLVIVRMFSHKDGRNPNQ